MFPHRWSGSVLTVSGRRLGTRDNPTEGGIYGMELEDQSSPSQFTAFPESRIQEAFRRRLSQMATSDGIQSSIIR